MSIDDSVIIKYILPQQTSKPTNKQDSYFIDNKRNTCNITTADILYLIMRKKLNTFYNFYQHLVCLISLKEVLS